MMQVHDYLAELGFAGIKVLACVWRCLESIYFSFASSSNSLSEFDDDDELAPADLADEFTRYLDAGYGFDIRHSLQPWHHHAESPFDAVPMCGERFHF